MLTITDLRKTFDTTVALDGLSLHVGPPAVSESGQECEPAMRAGAGEIFGLLGPNGAGKTTLIAIATGLLAPDSGSVRLAGIGPPTDASARRKLGFAPQRDALYDTLTARENLEFFGRLAGLASRDARARASELLVRVGLGDRSSDRARGFSGGMKRRLNLAAALMHDPPLLLLDEPSAGVDPHSRLAMYELVCELRDQGRVILYTTHDMAEAQRLCDRVGVIDHGRLLAMDTPEGLIATHGGSSRVRVRFRDGTEQVHAAADPMRTLAGLDLRPDDAADAVGGTPGLDGSSGASVVQRDPSSVIDAVTIDRPDLEAVFLNLTGRSLRD